MGDIFFQYNFLEIFKICLYSLYINFLWRVYVDLIAKWCNDGLSQKINELDLSLVLMLFEF